VREAICDTSPIQYLHQIGLLHLLGEFYSRTLVPPAVVDELNRGRALAIDLPEILDVPWVRVQAPEGLQKVPTVTDLGAGEKEVLALGMQVPSAVVILDDRLGRVYAEALKINFTGTLGILLRAKIESHIPRVAPLLDRLDRLGFRVSARTRAAVLQQAGE